MASTSLQLFFNVGMSTIASDGRTSFCQRLGWSESEVEASLHPGPRRDAFEVLLDEHFSCCCSGGRVIFMQGPLRVYYHLLFYWWCKLVEWRFKRFLSRVRFLSTVSGLCAFNGWCVKLWVGPAQSSSGCTCGITPSFDPCCLAPCLVSSHFS